MIEICLYSDRYTMTSMNIPEPVMSLAIMPKTREASGSFSKALSRFQKEDPTFKARSLILWVFVRPVLDLSVSLWAGQNGCVQHMRVKMWLQVSSDPETGQTIISGMGELHLEIYVERMNREYKVCSSSHPATAHGAAQALSRLYSSACRRYMDLEGPHLLHSFFVAYSNGQPSLCSLGRFSHTIDVSGHFVVPQVDADVGKPRVNYLEAITQRVTFDYLHKKQSGVCKESSLLARYLAGWLRCAV